mmetsp:Transcript_4971/g.10706  ORF Transcript_4971/g.10706 Transcript_4971/m.10706 type:complete len:397 (-) Transcript_4971:2272-3462(-)|eukprot:CAMPEP_0202891922 /NCGR_PEP_ID=MMETSP1392-20130828/1832_1 /ASSEMBLY_ACC=CAM_ASM_000868 /TAXON_ID=225041 /ORGANISM="Chlamydomonas chlamydogama, Strain SAG 11-48b" /LENGTH=396 /DNA_ID=CAMNT_0049575789 /DNA_START=296 /DNA_END=1486 /DNA_ORIENTATION=+
MASGSVAGPFQQLGKRARSLEESEPLGEDFECAVCCDLLHEPVVAPCGHDMCAHCYKRWVALSTTKVGAQCPLCRDPLPASLGVCLRLKRTIESLYPEACARRKVEVERQIAERCEAKPIQEDLAATTPRAFAMMSHPSPDLAMSASIPWFSVPPAHPWPAAMAMAAAVQMMSSLYPQAAMLQQHSVPSHSGHPSSSSQSASQSALGDDVAPGMPVLYHALGSNWCQQAMPGGGMPAHPLACHPYPSATHLLSDFYTQPHEPAAPYADDLNPASAASVMDQQDPQQLQQPVSPPSGRWQSSSDGELRLQCARSIIRLLRARGLHTTLGARFPALVRMLEVALYRSASSRTAYMDTSTLGSRVAVLVQRYNQAAAAARQQQAGTETASAIRTSLAAA